MVHKALVSIGASIAIVAIGTASYFALGGAAPNAKACPGGLAGATIGGPFTLTTHLGQQVTEKDFLGSPTLVYFGFATCPDICPTELADMAAAAEILNKDDKRDVKPVFVTVDPQRDTTELLSEYIPFFSESLIGLTGTEKQVAQAAKAYRVYYKRVNDPEFPDGYTMDHSSQIFLMGADGKFQAFFKGGDSAELIAERSACHIDAAA